MENKKIRIRILKLSQESIECGCRNVMIGWKLDAHDAEGKYYQMTGQYFSNVVLKSDCEVI